MLYEVITFMRNMHRNMAKALNASQGQWENLWAVRPAGTTRLPTREDVLAKIAYTAANPIIVITSYSIHYTKLYDCATAALPGFQSISPGHLSGLSTSAAMMGLAAV